MRNKYSVLTIVMLNLLFLAYAQEDDEKHFSLELYGNMIYQHFDYGANQRATTTGSKDDNRAILDIPKFALEPEFSFTKDFFLEAEIEFEHLGTGSALELEYEEFGEYEFESEKGGEVQLEEIHLNKRFTNELNVRVGRFPIPITLYNKKHKPMNYFSNTPPESEINILPSTWNEIGVEVFGSAFNFNYNLALVNGLDASGFSSERWIAEGHQTKFEFVKATNLATILRLDYAGINNLLFGGSIYYGNSTGNRPKPEDMEGIDAHVTITSLHAQYISDPVIIRSDYIYGNLENSDLVSQRNARLSVNIQTPRSPVAKNAIAYYIEGGYNIASIISIPTEFKLYPFFRYEYYNTMKEVEKGIFANPRFERSLYTFGLNFIWNDEVVFKADYSSRTVGKGSFNTENTISVGIGFLTSVIN